MIITGGTFTTGVHLHKVDLPPEVVLDSILINSMPSNNYANVSFINSPTNNTTYYSFNGTSQYLQTDDILTTGLTDDITYEMWIRTTTSAEGCLLAKQTTEGYHTSVIEIGNTKIIPGYWLGMQVGYTTVNSFLVRDVWQHYVVVCGSGNITTYYNTVLAGSDTLGNEITPLDYGTLSMFFTMFQQETTNFGYGGYLAGDFGELRIYSRQLTLTEIEQNFAVTRGRYGV